MFKDIGSTPGTTKQTNLQEYLKVSDKAVYTVSTTVIDFPANYRKQLLNMKIFKK